MRSKKKGKRLTPHQQGTAPLPLPQERYAAANRLCTTGIQSYQRGCLQEAMHLWQQALQVSPDFAPAMLNLGVAYRDMGNMEEAIRFFQKALAIRPAFPEAYYNLGFTWHILGRFREAMAPYLEAIRYRPDFAEAQTNLDVLLEQDIKDPQVARACYEKLWQLVPHIDKVGPRRLRIEVASACNLRCQHCPTGTNYRGTERRVMSMTTFEEILEQMQDMPILREVVLYLSGEPLLNKNLPVMCRRIKDETPVTQVLFNTNAMLLTEEWCHELAHAGVDKIHISIDGRSPEENDLIRVGARYQTIVQNVNLLRHIARDVQLVIVNTVFKRPGDPATPATPDFLARDFPGVPVWTNYAMKWPGLDLHNSSLRGLEIVVDERIDGFCKMPFTQMAVCPNGDVVLCCYDLLGEQVMGNIRQKTLMDIWTDSAYKNLRHTMLREKTDSLPHVCKKCPVYSGEMPVARVEQFPFVL
jgi:radical SAM protein with 4Fe4S-binding SPASM domain